MKPKPIAVLVAAASLLAPAGAQAHVSIHPNTIPAGAFATIDVRVPGEQQGAYVKRVDTLLPAGFTSVDYETVRGLEREGGRKQARQAARAKTARRSTRRSRRSCGRGQGRRARSATASSCSFRCRSRSPPTRAARPLEFRTVETYSDGQVVHWIDPSLDAEHPSPRINVTAKGGVIEDVAGDEAGPAAGQTGGTAGASGSPASRPLRRSPAATASEGLGIAALIVGALGLLAGIGALVAARRARRAQLSRSRHGSFRQ